jgi:hypothetical protein
VLPAGFGALAAVLSHIRVAQSLAGFGASFTDRSTRSARVTVQRRVTENEVTGGMANARAVLEQADVFGLGVRTAFFEAVTNCVHTSVVCLLTIVQALV